MNGDPAGIRTRVIAVKGRCLDHLTTGPHHQRSPPLMGIGRGEGIRTPGPMLPKHVRYQTALHPEGLTVYHRRRDILYIRPSGLSTIILRFFSFAAGFAEFSRSRRFAPRPKRGKAVSGRPPRTHRSRPQPGITSTAPSARCPRPRRGRAGRKARDARRNSRRQR